MAKIIIIGAGGVGQVVAHKCAQMADVFDEIVLASRTESKCKKIAEQIQQSYGRSIETAAVDADKVPELVALFERVKPFYGDQCRLALSGSDDYGCLSRSWRALYGYRQLRAAGYCEV